MRKDEKEHKKSSSSESSPMRSFPFISNILSNEAKRSSSTSPVRNSVSTMGLDEKGARKPSSLSGSPTGSRLAKSMGKRDSKELAGHLKDAFTQLEKNEISLTEEELKSRLDIAQKESKPDKKKKDLAQLACAKVKNPSFEVAIMKQYASSTVFDMNAHQIEVMLQNRLTYHNQKNEQEAANQILPIIKLFWEQHDLLLQLYEAEDIANDYHMNRWRTWIKMAPIFKKLEEHLQKDAAHEFKKLQEYQDSIKKEQFLPQ